MNYMNDEVENMSSQDIKTLTLLLQIRQHNHNYKNEFLENQIQDYIASLKIQGADLKELIGICTRYDYNLNT